MSRSTVLIKLFAAVALAGAALLTLAGSAEASHLPRTHSCSEVIIRNPVGGGVYTRTYGLRANGVSCRQARKVARARLVDDAQPRSKYHGFKCENRAKGISCHKGDHRISWRFRPNRAAATTLARGRAHHPSTREYKAIKESVQHESPGEEYWCPQRKSTYLSGRNRRWAAAVMLSNCNLGSQTVRFFSFKNNGRWHVAQKKLEKLGTGKPPPCGTAPVPKDIRCAALRIPIDGASKRTRKKRPKIECSYSNRLYRSAPHSCTLSEHAARSRYPLRQLHWKHWGRRHTVARGRINSRSLTGRIRVVLSRIQRGFCEPGRFYTQAHIKVLSGPHGGKEINLNIAAGCPA